MSQVLTRRGLVAAAPAAIVAAAVPAIAAGAGNLDAELLALRGPWLATLAGIDAASPAHTRAEDAFIAAKQAHPDVDRAALSKATGFDKAERVWLRAVNANTEVLLSIIETPARTLEGVLFKAQACGKADYDSELAISIVTDLLAMAGGADA